MATTQQQASQQAAAALGKLSPQQFEKFKKLDQRKQTEFVRHLILYQKWCRVYKPELDSVAPDPLDPPKRYHDGVFVELDHLSGTGTMFHVTGDIIAASGMRYEEKRAYQPSVSARLHSNTQIGWVLREDYDKGLIGSILRALPTPPKQQGLNFWERNPVTGRHDLIWTKANGNPYGPNEQRPAIFKCNEWTENGAIRILRQRGILVNQPS